MAEVARLRKHKCAECGRKRPAVWSQRVFNRQGVEIRYRCDECAPLIRNPIDDSMRLLRMMLGA